VWIPWCFGQLISQTDGLIPSSRLMEEEQHVSLA
jgi:hypothetical protein